MAAKMLRARHGIALLLVVAGLVPAMHRATADAPAGRYTVQNGGTPTGTVLDTKTGLTWQQAVPSGTYNQANAKSYCTSNTPGLPGAGWRLPSVGELLTIVDDSRTSPAIDPTAFPGTPSSVFWSSSSASPMEAWHVHFVGGGGGYGFATNYYRVRCVR